MQYKNAGQIEEDSKFDCMLGIECRYANIIWVFFFIFSCPLGKSKMMF